jgi:hypothetical protein
MYHAILGRPTYAKFMAVPNYAYLKLKMPGPKGVITINTTFQHPMSAMSNASSSRKHSSALRNSPQPTPEVLDILETSKRVLLSPPRKLKRYPSPTTNARSASAQHSDLSGKRHSWVYCGRTLMCLPRRHMLGIPRVVAEHKLNIKLSARPVKQKL